MVRSVLELLTCCVSLDRLLNLSKPHLQIEDNNTYLKKALKLQNEIYIEGGASYQ